MPDKFHEWKDYYKWDEEDFLQIQSTPCIVCAKTRTIGVVYGHPTEVKYFCGEHLPEEFWSYERKKGTANG